MCGANAMMVASAALQVGTAVLAYQDKKNAAKMKRADNQVAMGHYNAVSYTHLTLPTIYSV